VNSDPKLPEIRKEAFVKAREKLSLSTKDLGGMACLSTRQIEQIENGETSSFYGAQIKVTAAKKVAKLLNLSEEDAFDFGSSAPEKYSAEASQLPIAEVKLADDPEKESVKKVSTKKEVEVTKEVVEKTQTPELLLEEKKESAVKVEPVKAPSKEIPFSSTIASSKTSSSKRFLLWLSIIAAMLFAVINLLQPLFFADKPEEIVVVKEGVVEPVSSATPAAPAEPAQSAPATVAPVVAAPAVSAELSTACPAEEGIISYKPDAPRKAGDMVYVQVKSMQVVCVSDASGKMQNKMVEPGVGASFYGKPPFKVLTTGLNQVDVFFQGAKVRLANPNSKTLILEASEIAAPAVDRTDSQLR
jgi:transcriptional regulator with XRE-family HTH domain